MTPVGAAFFFGGIAMMCSGIALTPATGFISPLFFVGIMWMILGATVFND